MDKVLEYVSTRLAKEELRHEIHKFDSGAVMIDIWKNDLLYVVQIEDKRIGLSLVTANNGFDIAPDKAYYDFESFSIDFDRIFECVP
jgi:hypothetical protein